MSFKLAAITCALFAMSGSALAQNNAHRPLRVAENFADASTVDDSVAKLTVRTAFSPSPTLSRQELFGLWLFMSVPRQAARHSMQGGKP